MSSTPNLPRVLALACLLGPLLPAAAQGVAAPAEVASAPKPANPKDERKAERPHITVIEDDGVRIEEHRVRGVVTKVVVQSKVGGAPAYEIQVAPPGRESMSDRGSAGKRTWSLLRF
jgi:hypothetical protein